MGYYPQWMQSDFPVSKIDQPLTKGNYQLTWNATKEMSGIYFIRIESENYSSTKKVLLLK